MQYIYAKAANSQKGFSMLEAVVGTAIILSVFVGLITAYNIALKTSLGIAESIKAIYLLEEGIEAVIVMRDEGWDDNIASISPDNPYEFYWDGNTWTATTTPQVIDGLYVREFVVSPVYRDDNDDISSGGTLDDGTKKITVTVSWRSKQKEMATYITRAFEN